MERGHFVCNSRNQGSVRPKSHLIASYKLYLNPVLSGCFLGGWVFIHRDVL